MMTLERRAASRLPAAHRNLLLGALTLAVTFGLGNNGGGCVGADPVPDEGSGGPCEAAADCAGQTPTDCSGEAGGWTCNTGVCEYVCEGGGTTGPGTDPEADTAGGGDDSSTDPGTDPQPDGDDGPEPDGDDGPEPDGNDGPDPECATDDDCSDGDQCVLGDCVPTAQPDPCFASGCSGQVCSTEQVATTCEWLPEFDCLQFSECGSFAADGGCGWLQTDAYIACMAGLDDCQSDDDCANGEVCVAGDCEKETLPECLVSGCSGEVCAPALMDSVCIWLPEFECLELTECGNFGGNGACGWDPNEEYLACLAAIGGCTNNSECASDEVCVDGECQEKDPAGCVISGCNGEICAPEPMVSACVAEEWHICLKYTSCGPNTAAGACGWAQTNAFLECLDDVGGGGGGECTADSDCGPNQECQLDCPACDCDPTWPTCACMECLGECVDTEPEYCNSDADCPNGWTCDCDFGGTAGGGAGEDVACAPVCIPPDDVTCDVDADCDLGQYCSFEECDACNCGGVPNGVPCFCPPCEGVCQDEEPEACESDEDCPMGWLCDGGECIDDPWLPNCISDADCDPGWTCGCGDFFGSGGSPNGFVACSMQCLPPDDGGACMDDSECANGQICDTENYCEGAPSCMPGVPCEPVCYGKCVDPPTGCASSLDCKDGYICEAAACVEDPWYNECWTDEECGPGYICECQDPWAWSANALVIACVNKCVEDPNANTCTDDSQCGEGQICLSDECGPCDCPPPIPGGPTCACPACEGVCVDGEPDPGACMDDSECPSDFICNTWDYCLSPPGCDPSQPCPAVCYGMCEYGGAEECFADEDCPAGQICEYGGTSTEPCDPSGGGCGAPAPPIGQCVDAPKTECIVSGCSSQVCAEEPVFTTCEWLPIYQCFQLTACGNYGEGGGCGWEETDEFLECIANNGGSSP